MPPEDGVARYREYFAYALERADTINVVAEPTFLFWQPWVKGLTQYVRWMGNLLRGDLGDAFVSSESVSSLILNRLPVSLELGGHGAGHFPVDRAAGGDLTRASAPIPCRTMSCAASRSC